MLLFALCHNTHGTGAAVAGDDTSGLQPGEGCKAFCLDGSFCSSFYLGIHIGRVDQINMGSVRIMLLHKIPDQGRNDLLHGTAVFLSGGQSAVQNIDAGMQIQQVAYQSDGIAGDSPGSWG